MWHAINAATIILTLFNVQIMSENVIGRLFLSFEYNNPQGKLIDGDQCDYFDTCDVYFFICIRYIGSSTCDIYNNTTSIYRDIKELSPIDMNATEILLTSPIGKRVEIFIDIWDFDGLDAADLIAKYDGLVESKPLSMNWSQIKLTRTDLDYHNDISFKAFVRMECQDRPCNVGCIPRKGINTCDDEGNIICEKGLTGPTCSETNHCVENNCADYAVCHSLPNGYKCVCDTYEGLACQKGYDPCQPNSPCGSHGQCKASGPNYECVCETGWVGNHCERPETACESAAKRLNPEAVCLNGGSCVDSSDGNSYNCICHQPWSGPRCEVIDTGENCAGEKCSGHGVCVFSSTSNERFYCKCNAGWFGDSCSYPSHSPCYRASLKLHTNLSMVCLNGGICIDNQNGVDFTCDCKFGWLGPRCETFFIKTFYFILPAAIGSLLFFIILTLCIRILRRHKTKHRVAPMTYMAMPVAESNDRDPNTSKIVPYAVYISSDWKGVGNQRKEPRVFRKPSLSDFNGRTSEEDMPPALPSRNNLPKTHPIVPQPEDKSSSFNR
ncbi:hypothetical protein Aperf_G00000035920 [Anoplocephala perfoliata]